MAYMSRADDQNVYFETAIDYKEDPITPEMISDLLDEIVDILGSDTVALLAARKDEWNDKTTRYVAISESLDEFTIAQRDNLMDEIGDNPGDRD